MFSDRLFKKMKGSTNNKEENYVIHCQGCSGSQPLSNYVNLRKKGLHWLLLLLLAL